MHKLRFYLNIAPPDFLKYYNGTANTISVLSDDGRRIEFPAEHLRQFVTHQGIEGNFEIEFDQQFKIRQLRRI
jgi:hypothetical protein